MLLLAQQMRLKESAFCRECGSMWILQCSTLGKPRILGLLLVYIGLEVHNVTIQVVGIMEFIILKVTKVMSIHTSLHSACSALRHMLGWH